MVKMGAFVRFSTIGLGAALALAMVAMPSEAMAAGDNVPDAVIDHVVDGRDLSFQNPITGSTATVIFPEWLVQVPESVPLIGGESINFGITRHLAIMWVVAVLLMVFVSLAARKASMVPKGFYSLVETLVKFVRDELAYKNIAHNADHYVPYLCTAFFFIFALNLMGLVPYSAAATGNLAVTTGLALLTFGMTLYSGMKGQGVVGFWASIVPAGVPLWLYPVMIPVELLGLLTKPFALCIRLFANMAAGGIVLGFLLGLIFLLPEASGVVAPISVAFAAGMFFLKIFVSLLQAYIFTMLSALFIGMASQPH